MAFNPQKIQDLAIDLRAGLNRLAQLDKEIDRVKQELSNNADLAESI